MILCQDVWKAYGPNDVLRGFSATFEQGRVAVLVGPNGAGKTTLMRIIAGLQWPDNGVVRSRRAAYYSGFDSVPVRGTVDRLRRAVGLPPAGERGAARLSRLSRGQLHIAGLEIVLDLDSDALLLDEPWTALDPDAREKLTMRLRDIAAAGKVVVCSTHDLAEAALVADDVVFLREGRAFAVRREDSAGDFDREQLLATYRRA